MSTSERRLLGGDDGDGVVLWSVATVRSNEHVRNMDQIDTVGANHSSGQWMGVYDQQPKKKESKASVVRSWLVSMQPICSLADDVIVTGV